jgi:oxygen-dependent protoporphyrinogen oxidase
MVEEHGSLTAALKARARAKPPGRPGAALGGTLLKPQGGMEALVAALARGLAGRLRTGAPVRAIERAPGGYRIRTRCGESFRAARVALAVPLAAARELLAGPAPEAAAALAPMQAEGLVSLVHAYLRSHVAHALDGIGYLAPKKAGGLVLGTLFSSTLDPGAAPEGHVLLRTLLGGARRPEALALGDGELLEQVARECSGLLGLARGPVFAHVARYPAAIPRFDLEHLSRLARLTEALPPGLLMLGNFTRGLGLESLVGAARSAARAP